MNEPPDAKSAEKQYTLRWPAADGAAGQASFPSLTASFAGLLQYEAACLSDGCTAPLPPWEITCHLPGRAATPNARPRYVYHVNARATGGGGGEGTEESPWWGLATAVEQLSRLNQVGQIRLRAGQTVRLAHHEVFTATSIERWKKIKESIARFVFLGTTVALIVPMAAILTYLLVQAWPALSFSFLVENPHDYMTSGGIWAPLVGTFWLVWISLLIAAPVGVLAGVYLNEYARNNWFTRIINLAVVNLAGVPSIVHALFGVGAFVMFAGMGRSLLAASCTLAVMTLPVIITSTREALAAVPIAFREACWNLGASRWQTIRTIVLPNSISGILTGVILQVSRAAGETAPILFTGAVFFSTLPEHGIQAFFPYGLGDRCMALSMHLFTLSTQVRGVTPALQYGTAVVLIGLVLAVNSLSIGLRVYVRSRKKW
ncbi:MAG: phosphate ABC transporter permease PstA [Thermoguttaceae bacterium]